MGAFAGSRLDKWAKRLAEAIAEETKCKEKVRQLERNPSKSSRDRFEARNKLNSASWKRKTIEREIT